jgi:hypothetical protein
MTAFLFKMRGFNLANRDVHHPLWKVSFGGSPIPDEDGAKD